MKKNIVTIISFLVLMFTSVFITGCENKYKNLEFEVYYAYTQNAETWFDASAGVSVCYGDNALLSVDADGNISSLYFKVVVKNVKEKHIGKIVVSPTATQGLEKAEFDVGNEEVFELKIKGNVQTDIVVYENNSGKSTRFSLSITKSLTRIDTDLSLKPATTLKSELDLTAVGDRVLTYYPLNETSEVGAYYSVESIGAFAGGAFIENISKDNASQYVKIENNKLTFIKGADDKYKLATNLNLHYAVKIKATSKYHNEEGHEIANYFYVYVTEETQSTSPIVVQANGNNLLEEDGVAYVDLYENSAEFNSIDLNVGMGTFDSVYNSATSTNDSVAKYNFDVYVGVENIKDGDYYNFNQQSQNVNGLYITTSGAGKYTIQIEASAFSQNNTLTFTYNLAGLDFSFINASDVPKYSKTITVVRHVMPLYLLINNQKLETGKNDTAKIYSTGNDTNEKYELLLDYSPVDIAGTENTIIIENIDNLEFYDAKGNIIAVTNKKIEIERGDKIYVKFNSTAVTNDIVTIKTLTTPTKFNGEDVESSKIQYITKDFTFVNSRTIKEKPAMYLDKDGIYSNLTIGADRTSYLYIKTSCDGTLDTSSVQLTLPTDCGFKFIDENSYEKLAITLSNCESVGNGWYKVGVKASDAESTAKISVVVGDGNLGLNTEFEIKSKYVLSNTNSIQITGTSPAINYTTLDNGNYLYALENGATAEFDAYYDANQTKAIQSISVERASLTGMSENFNQSALDFEVIGKTFNVTAKYAKTAILDVKVNYYYYPTESSILTLGSVVKKVEVAIYDPIAYISINATSPISNFKDSITYINSLYTSVTKTTLSYIAYTKTYGTPTSTLYFSSNKQVDNVSKLILSTSWAGDASVKNSVTLVQSSTNLNTGSAIELGVRGTMDMQLVSAVNVDSVAVTLTAKTLESEKSNIFGTKTIKIVEVQKATGIEYSTTGLTHVGNVYDVNLSQMKLEDGGFDTKEISVGATYGDVIYQNQVRFGDLCFTLEEYEVDENGNVKYQDGEPIIKITLKRNATEYLSDKISVSYANGKLTLKTKKGSTGGKYKLTISTFDSYNETEYTNSMSLNVNVGDGSEKYKFTISDKEDFNYIYSNMDKHFVLTSDLALGTYNVSINPNTHEFDSAKVSFEGTLSGLYTSGKTSMQYKISYTPSAGSGTDNVSYAGLFSQLGEDGVISNIDFDITLGSAYDSTTTQNFYVGGLVGYNKGVIKNVNLSINNSNTSLTASEGTNNSICFGGIAGKNDGTIINANVQYRGEVNLTSAFKTLNIGGLVGENAGTITGSYDGTLDNIAFDAYVLLSVENTRTENKATYNVGGVAGITSGSISNLLVSGSIKGTEGDDSTEKTTGYLAGIAGTSSAKIANVATISLELSSYNAPKVDVAGLVGTTSANVENSKVIFAVLKIDGEKQYGYVSGQNVSAGLVANLNGGTIKYCSVETFNSTSVISGNEVYGLVHVASGNVQNSFAKCNLEVLKENPTMNTDYFLTVDTDESNTYFLGKVKTNEGAVNIERIYAKYKVGNISFEDELVDFVNPDGTFNTNWNVDVSGDTTNWGTEAGKNQIKYNNVNYDFPYLKKDGKPLQIIAPESISASQNQDYIIIIDSNYLDAQSIDVEGTNPTYTITESSVINYHYSSNNNDLLNNNTYNLVNTAEDGETPNGLIDLTTLPIDASQGLTFELVNKGYLYAYISNNTTITFTGRSGNTPIIVKVSSAFNEDASAYFAFYTQTGVSDLILSASDIQEIENTNASTDTTGKENANEYMLNLYIGEKKTITIDAENIYNDVEFDSLFDYQSLISKYTIEEEHYDSDDNLIAKADWKISSSKNERNFTININDLSVEYGSVEKIKYTLKLNDYSVEVKNVWLTVKMYPSATALTIAKSNDEYIEPSTSNFEIDVNLKTTFVKDNVTISSLTFDNATSSFTVESAEGDSIVVKVECVDTDKTEINRLLNATGATSIVNLFDFDKSNVVKTKTADGYNFKLTFALKDEYAYRYLLNPIQFKMTISATSLSTIKDDFTFTINPTKANTVRVESYAVEKINVDTYFTKLVATNEKQTSIIDPSGVGNIFAIYIEPNYSNVTSAYLTSGDLYVPSLGKNVYLKYSQYVLNDDGKFVNLFGANTSNQETNGEHKFELNLVSQKKNGNYVYNGILYVRVQIEKFAGLEDVISAYLTVESTNGSDTSTKSLEKKLLTQYLPGAEIAYNTTLEYTKADGYLVQDGSTSNVANIKVWGYQFNSNPTISLGWNLTNGSKYVYTNKTALSISSQAELTEYMNDNEVTFVYAEKDGYSYKMATLETGYTYYEITSTAFITDGTDTYLIGDYVIYDLLTDEVEYNSADDSYSMPLKFKVVSGIPTSFKVTASLDLVTKAGQIESGESREIVFYPADYLISSVYLDRISNNQKSLAIGKSTKLTLKFETALDEDLSSEIFSRMIANLAPAPTYDFTNILKQFSYVDGADTITFDTLTTDDSDNPIYIRIDNNQIILYADAVFNNNVNLSVKYDYVLNAETGCYEINFTKSDWTKEYNFQLILHEPSSEENAIPIYSASDMFDENGNSLLAENGHYILMNDITLDVAIKPIETNIGSFDGNNRVIKLSGFVIDPSKTNYGLFATLGTYTEDENTYKSILKNVIVDYSSVTTLSLVDNDIENIVFGGLVAENNGGLIYNCDVINSNTGTAKINIIVDNSTEVDVTAGLFVGINSSEESIITNSRVGRSSYTKIIASRDSAESTITRNCGKLQLAVYSNNNVGEAYNIKVAGFAGVNEGTIASCYVANTTIENSSNSVDENMTAGFVALNSGKISYSYVKAQTNDYSNIQLQNNNITQKGNGSVGGFVYKNSGEIDNAYSNILLQTKSAFIAGFVYENEGTISRSYSACAMNSLSTNDNAEQPFVGVDSSNNLLSNGTFTNVYYYKESGMFDDLKKDKPQAVGLSLTNFQDTENLFGFIFIDSNSAVERSQGTWSYYDVNTGKKYSLPELNAPNMVAHSYRYLRTTKLDENNLTQYIYSYAYDYEQGLSTNPYIVRSVEEFNNVFAEENEFNGYVRFIDNIDFSSDPSSIQTKTNYTLGSEIKLESTSVDGNGMTLSGLYLNADETTIYSIGLFAEIQNAHVANLNLEFVDPGEDNEHQFSTTSAIYSGGLAGKITDSVIININLSGSNTTLVGNNFVGGLAGAIKGSSLVYHITSSLNVKAVKESTTNVYYSQSDYDDLAISLLPYDAENKDCYAKYLSYAGGIAGVVDLTKRANIEFNFAYNEVLGTKMATISSKQNVQQACISADYAGGVAGYLGNGVDALKLKYRVGGAEYIQGNIVVGGISAVSFADLTACQVTSLETEQYEYDTELGEYVIDLNDDRTSASLDDTAIGNTSLLRSGDNGYTGGLVGISVDGLITACYSKASIAGGKVIGGLIAHNLATRITYSYAVPYININAFTSLENVKIGGLVGEARKYQKSTSLSSNLKDYEKIARLYGDAEKTTNVIFAFSTILMDLDALAEKFDSTTINYTCADGNENINCACTYYGNINYGTTAGLENYVKSTTLTTMKEMYILYDTTGENASEQNSTFNEIFASWSVIRYWSLDHTKYFPLLLDEQEDDYIIIRSEEDFDLIRANPSGNFKIVNDIICSKTYTNWVFDINFTGKLVGQIEGTNDSPVVSGLKVKTNQDGTAGLFKSTQGALISSVKFAWDSIYIDDGTISTVAGVTCENKADGAETTLISNVTVTFGELTYGTNQSISGFAGLVGTGVNVNIISGKVKTNDTLDIKLASVDTNNLFGGLVGDLATQDGIGATEQGTSIIIDSDVEINAEITINSIMSSYIGGGVAKIENASISGLNLHDSSITICYGTNAEPTSYVGGLVAHSTNTPIVKSDITKTAFQIEGNFGKSETQLLIGGAIGYYIHGTTGSSLEDLSTNIDFDLTELKTEGAIVLAGGIAKLEGSTAKLKRCLFMGTATSDSENSQMTGVYAGGAVADASVNLENDEDYTLQEVVSNFNIILGSSATTTFVAGDLVGKSSEELKITDSISSGRIVPIATSGVTVGGVVGEVSADSTLNNIISTTSIICDSMQACVYNNTNIKAILGNVNGKVITINNVVYSSDIALCTDTLGKNWNAEYLYANLASFNDLELWSSTSCLPYIISLKDKMLEQGLFKSDAYKQGSSLNPSTSIIASTEYTYYFWTSAMSGGVADGFELNGIIIGAESKFDVTATNLAFNTDCSGLLPHVKKHSVVSNMHLNMNFGTYTTGLNKTAGILVGLNEGVIYNSSVSGTNVDLDAANLVGLLAGANSGLISSSFADAEIINSSISVAGIVGYNSGTVLSCYFTGYIESDSLSAGIVYQNKYNDTNGNFYNCYQAGVINAEYYGTNSFVAVDDIVGENNYVDKYANLENGTGNVSFVETKDLAKNFNSKLVGDWITDDTTEIVDGVYVSAYNYQYPIISFGKYYYNSGDDNGTKDEFKYSLFTGTGKTLSYLEDKDEDGELEEYQFTLTDRYAYVKNGANLNDLKTTLASANKTLNGTILDSETTYYDTVMKISHLGLLTILPTNTAIPSNASRNPNELWNRNVVLVYDVNGDKYNVGTNFEWTSPEFYGLFLTNKYYDNGSDYCTVENLAKNGVLNVTTGESLIGNIEFGSMTNLTASGAFATTIDVPTTIYNVSFANGATLEGSTLGGIVGTINADVTLGSLGVDNVLLNKVDTTNLQIGKDKDNKVNSAGIIAYAMTSGTLNGNILTTNTTDSYQIGNVYASTFGGIVGVVNTSEPEGAGAENNAVIKNFAVEFAEGKDYNIGTFGGIVATAKAEITDTSLTIQDISVSFEDNDFVSTTFGGIIATASGDITIRNGADETPAVIKLAYKNTIEATDFGGFIAICNGDSSVINIYDYEVTYTGEISASKFGGLVCQNDATLNLINVETMNSQISIGGSVYTSTFGGLINTVTGDTTIKKCSLTCSGAIKGTKGTGGTDYNDTEFGGMIYSITGDTTTIESVTMNITGTNIKANTMGGVINKISSDVLQAEIQTANVTFSGDTYEEIKNFGGVIYSIENQKTLTLGNCAVTYNVSEMTANNFGGIATKVNGVLNASSITIESGDLTISEFSNYAGWLAGEIGLDEDDSQINVSTALQLPDQELKVERETASTNETTQGVGTFVGNMKGDIIINCEVGLTADTKVTAVNVNNIGGVAGIYQSGDLTCANFGIVTISGTKNVGGIFGNVDEISGENLNNALRGFQTVTADEGSKKNAEIEFGDEETIEKYENIGGLFGKLKVTAGTDAETVTLINENPIEIKGNPEQEDATATNVGGIAGLYEGSSAGNFTNTADITIDGMTEDPDMLKNKDDDDNYIVKAVNVGGVFGKANEIAEGTISMVSNAGKIQGYQNVGGIVGLLETNEVLTIDGGIDTDTFKTTDNLDNTSFSVGTTATAGSILGVINVGGLVGLAKGANIEIINYYSKTKVTGNSSVGGLVGYAKSIKLDNNVIDDTTLKGIYYEYKYTDTKDTEQTAVFIPTNIGGIAGVMKEVKLLSNIVRDTEINTSAEEDTMISRLKNYIISPTESTEILDKLKGDAKYMVSQFDATASGIGGIAGTIDATTMEYDVVSNTISTNNSIMDLTINAPLGINVGSCYGYVTCGDGKTATLGSGTRTEKLFYPHLNGNITIDGAYYVGGLIGYVSNGDGARTDATYIQGSYSIWLQTDITGMYIGGLFGRLDSNTSEDNKISSSVGFGLANYNQIVSYYVGGLVGELCVDKASSKFTGDVSLLDTTYSKNILVSSNFGGLVGKLKVANPTDTTTAHNVTVTGTHNFAFTINTIENGNYTDDIPQYTTDTSGTSLYLNAQTKYTNNDTFNISPTSDATFYDSTASNPTRTGGNGWAKDYTMFKLMQRCITQSNDDNTLWNSIAVLYDAYNIVNVGTLNNLGLYNTNDTTLKFYVSTPISYGGYTYNAGVYSLKDINDIKTQLNTIKSVQTDPNEIKKIDAEIAKCDKYDENYICYTVYEDSTGGRKLYSAVGIATPLIDSDGNYVSEVTSNKVSWIANLFRKKKNLSLYYINLNASNSLNTLGLTYLDLSDKYCYYGYTGTTSLITSGLNYKIITYKVGDYIYAFRYVYEENNGSNLASSGSVLEANGIMSTSTESNLNINSDDWLDVYATASSEDDGLFFKHTNSNVGIFADSYKTEVVYKDDETAGQITFMLTVDREITVNGVPYSFYSADRPTDFDGTNYLFKNEGYYKSLSGATINTKVGKAIEVDDNLVEGKDYIIDDNVVYLQGEYNSTDGYTGTGDTLDASSYYSPTASSSGKEGYDYLTGAYYTYDGTSGLEDENGYSIVKYAKFELDDTPYASKGTEDASCFYACDYQGWWHKYNLTGFLDESGDTLVSQAYQRDSFADDIIAYRTATEVSDSFNEIYIFMYPKQFTNPYDYVMANSRDTITYYRTDTKENAFSVDVTYFESDVTFIKTDAGSGYRALKRLAVIGSTEWNQVKYTPVNVWYNQGEGIGVDSIIITYEDIANILMDKITDGKEITDLISGNELEVKTKEFYLANMYMSEELNEAYKVSNIFKVFANTFYFRDTNDLQSVDGIGVVSVYKKVTAVDENASLNDLKYRVDEGLEFYTHYKYDDSLLEDDTWSGYCINYENGYNESGIYTPNKNFVTYLYEQCRVNFGGLIKCVDSDES